MSNQIEKAVTAEELSSNFEYFMNLANEGKLFVKEEIDAIEPDVDDIISKISACCKCKLNKDRTEDDIRCFILCEYDKDREAFMKRFSNKGKKRRLVAQLIGMMLSKGILKADVMDIVKWLRKWHLFNNVQDDSIAARIREGRRKI